MIDKRRLQTQHRGRVTLSLPSLSDSDSRYDIEAAAYSYRLHKCTSAAAAGEASGYTLPITSPNPTSQLDRTPGILELTLALILDTEFYHGINQDKPDFIPSSIFSSAESGTRDERHAGEIRVLFPGLIYSEFGSLPSMC